MVCQRLLVGTNGLAALTFCEVPIAEAADGVSMPNQPELRTIKTPTK